MAESLLLGSRSATCAGARDSEIHAGNVGLDLLRDIERNSENGLQAVKHLSLGVREHVIDQGHPTCRLVDPPARLRIQVRQGQVGQPDLGIQEPQGGRPLGVRQIGGANQATQALFYRMCRWLPDFMRRVLVGDAARRLPDGYDVATHFTPRYAPWDQRMCVVPGGDIFRAISSGRADVVTGTVDTFTERGIRLGDGHEIEADVVVAATGLEVLALGDMQVVVDGEVLAPGERIVYKSVLLSDVPNFAYVFGYTNASWTLKVDLACAWICRVIEHMRRTGATTVVATVDDPAMPTRSMLDLAAGYLLRAVDRIPRQGSGVWSVPKSYRADARRLLRDPIDDGVLQFSNAVKASLPVA